MVNIPGESLRGTTSKEVGAGLVSQASASSNMPFKEHHLKQLRAQCLVFLAFRHDEYLYLNFACFHLLLLIIINILFFLNYISTTWQKQFDA